MKFHFWSGYAILTLLLFRIAWGFVGSTTARFSRFRQRPVGGLPPPRRDWLGADRPRDVGHNPLGGAHGRGADLRGAGPGRRRPVLGRHRHRHGQRPARRLVADKWIDTATAFHHFWINVLLVLVGLHVLAAHRLSRLEAAEPDRRHVHRPQAARRCRAARASRRRALHFRLGPAGDFAADRCAAIVYFIVRSGG